MRAGASIAVLMIMLASCTAGDTSGPGATPPGLSPAGLPPLQDIAELGAEEIQAAPSPDWVLVAFGRAWVSGVDEGIAAYDAKTGKLEDSVAVPQDECASLAAGFGVVWTATCEGSRGVARIDPQAGKVVGHVAVDVPSDGESSIGAGEGGVWAISDGPDCTTCLLVEIDTRGDRIVGRYDIEEGATAVRAGLGGIWITYSDLDQVAHVDPATGEVVASIDVGLGPRFLDVGAGGVWIMNQSDGSVTHVDPQTDEVVATIPVDSVGIFGGDIAVGEGSVWLRGTEELVAQLDPATDAVVARFGPPAGSGSAEAGAGSLWISAHDETAIYRLPLD